MDALFLSLPPWGHLVYVGLLIGLGTTLYRKHQREHDLQEQNAAYLKAQDLLLRFRLMVEKGGQEIYLVTPDGQLVYVNQVATDSVGYTVQELLEIGIPGIDPQFGPTYRQHFEALKAGDLPPFETVHIAKDGREVPKEIKAVYLRIGEEEFVCGFGQDITERKRIEEALKRSQENLNRAQAVAHVGSWHLDLKQDLLEWSDETYRLFGVTADRPLNYEAFLSCVHPEDREAVDRAWKLALQGAPYDIEHRIQAYGQVKWVRERAELEFDEQGSLMGGVGTVQDITKRKMAEDALRQQETAFRTLVENVPGAVYRCELASPWRVFHMSEGVLGISGRQAREFMDGRITYADIIDPEDLALVERAVRRGVLHNQPYEVEYRIVHTDGGLRWVYEKGQAIPGPDGSPAYLDGVILDISTLKQAEAALRESERYNRSVFMHSPTGLALCRINGDLVDINPAYAAIIGRSVEETLTLSHWDITPDIYLKQERQQFQQLEKTGRYGPYEKEYIHADGHRVPVLLSGLLIEQKGERLILSSVEDISERKQARAALEHLVAELKQSEQQQRDLRLIAQREQGRMSALLTAMSIGILFEDRASRVEFVNPAFMRMWAIEDSVDLVGRPTRDVLEHSTHRFARPAHASKYVLQVLETHEISERYELDLYDGRILTQVSYPVTDPEGRFLGRLWIYEDITHERQTAQQLLYMAERDPLTGLFNRHRFQQQLDQMIQSAQRTSTRFALLYFDLDEFKYINDTFGHRAGDTVLIRTAGEIASIVRAGEMFARLGGDEFAILSSLASNEAIDTLPSRVVKSISAVPFRFRGSNLRLTASVGVALYPDHGDNTEDLVAHADAAMYQAKNLGKNTWAVYDPNRDASGAMLERMGWNQRIAQAMEGGLLELHFQGIYRTADRELSHLEALVRMRDPADPAQLIMPGHFIPIAEKSSQILEIDRWVLKRSVDLLAQHPRIPAIAVNVSGRSFDDPALPQYIRELLHIVGIDPSRLIIELTETSAVSDIQDAQRFIETLSRMGCRICMDDFGSGFSTFAYLKHLDAEILKIDGLFIQDLPNNPDNQAFVRAMVDVARGLQKLTIAEFVEDGPTLEMLHNLGVDMAQGYHLDRPSADHPALSR